MVEEKELLEEAINVRMTRSVYHKVVKWAGIESRKNADMARVLIKEALKAREENITTYSVKGAG